METFSRRDSRQCQNKRSCCKSARSCLKRHVIEEDVVKCLMSAFVWLLPVATQECSLPLADHGSFLVLRVRYDSSVLRCAFLFSFFWKQTFHWSPSLWWLYWLFLQVQIYKIPIHQFSFIHSFPAPVCSWAQGREGLLQPIPVVIGWRPGDTLD